MHKVVLALVSVTATALSFCDVAQAQLSEFAITVHDSLPLRSSPRINGPITRKAYLGEQFRILEQRFEWSHVTTKIYRDIHTAWADSGWVFTKDLHMESSQTGYALVEVDLSLLEVPPGSFKERVGADQFLDDPASLPASYYVSANYVPHGSPDVCSGPYSACARIYVPPNYFLYTERGRDSLRYDRLFNHGIMRPVYQIESRQKLKQVRVQVAVVRDVFDKHDCYDSHLLRRELVHLSDTTYASSAYRVAGNFIMPSTTVWKAGGKGEAGSALLVMIFDLVPERFPGWKERHVRTIRVWWPACT